MITSLFDRFAMMEEKILLSTVLRKFNLQENIECYY